MYLSTDPTSYKNNSTRSIKCSRKKHQPHLMPGHTIHILVHLDNNLPDSCSHLEINIQPGKEVQTINFNIPKKFPQS